VDGLDKKLDEGKIIDSLAEPDEALDALKLIKGNLDK